MSIQLDVYVGELSAGGTHLEKPRRFTLDERDDYPDAWTLDSSAILFSSNRNGLFNVFRQDLQKQTAVRILGSPDAEASGIQLTTDGDWMLYGSRMRENAPSPMVRLMRTPASGGSAEFVLETPLGKPDFHPTNFRCPRHAHYPCVLAEIKDNELLFFALEPLQGKGKELARTEVANHRFYGWAISAEGSSLAVVNGRDPFIQVFDLATASKRNVATPADWLLQSVAWSPDDNAVLVTVWTPRGFLLGRVDLAGHAQVLLNRGWSQWMNGIMPSPDGRYLAFGAQTWESNVWLLHDF
jgi:Tol biopolymer transport system component